MHRKRTIAASIALVLASGALIARADPKAYSVDPVPLQIYANFGYEQGMNNRGQICYWTDATFSGNRAYLWDGQQNIILPPAPDPPNRVPDAIATGINNAGIISGYYGYLYAQATAVYWDSEHQLHTIGTLGGNFAYAQAVNNDGVIAGVSDTAPVAFQRHLFTWDGTLHDQGNLPTFYDEVVSINNNGQILGRQGGSVIGGWIWQNGQYTSLKDSQGGIYSSPNDLNESGTAVGASWPHQNNARAVRWNGADPEALGVPAGATESWAYAINNRGTIVGWEKDPSSVFRRAMLWDKNEWHFLGDMLDDTISWNLTEAWDINDRGQILALGDAVGIGWRELLLTPDGQGRLVVSNISFVPEPGSAGLLMLGLLWGLRRRAPVR